MELVRYVFTLERHIFDAKIMTFKFAFSVFVETASGQGRAVAMSAVVGLLTTEQ